MNTLKLKTSAGKFGMIVSDSLSFIFFDNCYISEYCVENFVIYKGDEILLYLHNLPKTKILSTPS